MRIAAKKSTIGQSHVWSRRVWGPMIKANLSDRILPETRWVAALVIPFLVVAFGILYLFPQHTGVLFAWNIQPAMSAMMLGAAYAGGIYFFTKVLLTRQWHRVKIGFLPVMTFASLLGIATILHWDRFNHSHISFYAWVGLYWTTPFIVLVAWLRNRGQDFSQIDRQDIFIPRLAGLLVGAIGVITLGTGVVLFLTPSLIIGVWPWTITPLTARVMGAMFALPGVVGLGIAFDKRWSAARIILESQGFSILLILGAAARAWHEFDLAKPGSWLFVGGLGAMLIGIVLLYAFMQTKHRTQLGRESPNPVL